MRAVLLLILTTLSTAYGQTPDFTGVWSLDKKQSSNLPDPFEIVDEYILRVEQKGAESLTVAVEFTSRGQTLKGEAATCSLDGKPNTHKDSRGVEVKRSIRLDSGRLLMETEKTFTGEIQLTPMKEREEWQLSEDAKTLTITITNLKDPKSSPQTRVFRKV